MKEFCREKRKFEETARGIAVILYLRYLVIAALFAMNTGFLCADIIAYYPFEGDYQDALGDLQKAFSPIGDLIFVSGHTGSAVSFDGIDDTAVTTSFVVDDFSIAFWVKTTDVQPGGFNKFWNGKGLVNAYYPECGNDIGDWGISLEDTDKAGFGIGGECDETYDVQSVTAINDGLWHFVCCTRNGTTGEYKVYVDDGPAEDSRQHLPVYPRKPVALYLASVNNEPGKFLNGFLDELVFFDHVLSQGEIDALREHGVFLPSKAVLKSPANGTANIPYQAALQWTHPGIVNRYKIYLDTNAQLVEEPNLPYQPMLLEGTELFPASSTDPNASYIFDPVEINQEYYWRVDSLVAEPNWSDINPDSNEPGMDVYTWVKGDVWSFSGLPETVLFTESQDQYILPDPVTHQMPISPDIHFSVDLDAARPIISLEWLKDDIPIMIDGLKYSADTMQDPASASTTLTIYSAEEADEGRYAVRVTLDTMDQFSSPGASLYVSSEMIAHRYSFSGSAEDSAGDADGVIVDPNNFNITFENGQIVFDSSNDGDGSNDTSGDPNAHFVDLPNGLLSSLGNNMTLMVWFTWDDQADGRMERVFDFGINAAGLEGQSTGGQNSEYLMLTPQNNSFTNPKMQFESRFASSVQSLTAPPATPEQEVCTAVTWSSADDKMRMYVNGEEVDETDLNAKLSDLDDRNNWLGRSEWPGDKLFVGKINELRIYNIPLTGPWIKAIYQKGPDHDPLDADPCLFESPMDANGDCVVDLADFAVFAENWLWCGLLSCQP